MIAFSVLCDGAIRLTDMSFTSAASAGESVSRQKKLASV